MCVKKASISSAAIAEASAADDDGDVDDNNNNDVDGIINALFKLMKKLTVAVCNLQQCVLCASAEERGWRHLSDNIAAAT